MNDRKEKLLSVQEIVQKAIEEGATTVEQVHLSIASMPFDMLEKVDALQKPVGKAREIHDQTVGNIYETIRLLNERAGEVARTLLRGKDAS
ncbi:MAG: hypothetical protein K0Q76_1622 [Panacagrimonas sp.]|jgi:hypothetical protein|nr:hypothetical protein [Panacagrimonas sp.]MCC2656514.1 hypothetical protein [Panacagrimonas sp.]